MLFALCSLLFMKTLVDFAFETSSVFLRSSARSFFFRFLSTLFLLRACLSLLSSLLLLSSLPCSSSWNLGCHGSSSRQAVFHSVESKLTANGQGLPQGNEGHEGKEKRREETSNYFTLYSSVRWVDSCRKGSSGSRCFLWPFRSLFYN